MRGSYRSLTAMMTLLILAIACVPASAGSAASGARLEGQLIAVDGRPAAGYKVHLIDQRGDDLVQAVSDSDGVYSFRGLDAGSYSLGIELPQGLIAPVAAPPVELRGGHLARRDVKLLESGPEQAQVATGANYGFGMWWAGLAPSARAWTIVGMVAVAAVTVLALTESDDSPASAY
jgi:hypothetical protein